MILLFLAVSPTSPSPQSLLEASLAGPSCGVATIELRQQAALRPLWRDSEHHRITARLQGGVWSDVQHTPLADHDPSTPLEEGPYPFVLPGVGQWPNDPDPVLWKDGLPTPRPAGQGWLWTTPDYRLSWQPGRVNLEAPGRMQEEGGGWIEDLNWSLTFDAQGRPEREKGSLRAGEDGVALTFAWTVEYSWAACG
ncbi:MAG: hypothetical protein VX899_25410 [Myxococcota bacterium]|nr:hypothetical protein [Myxococcota bacterium]